MYKRQKSAYVDSVTAAQTAVTDALLGFETARVALEGATKTYLQRVADNDDYVQTLVAENEQLSADAKQTRDVATKLAELSFTSSISAPSDPF